jgi:hypothetical protein
MPSYTLYCPATSNGGNSNITNPNDAMNRWNTQQTSVFAYRQTQNISNDNIYIDYNIPSISSGQWRTADGTYITPPTGAMVSGLTLYSTLGAWRDRYLLLKPANNITVEVGGIISNTWSNYGSDTTSAGYSWTNKSGAAAFSNLSASYKYTVHTYISTSRTRSFRACFTNIYLSAVISWQEDQGETHLRHISNGNTVGVGTLRRKSSGTLVGKLLHNVTKRVLYRLPNQ